MKTFPRSARGFYHRTEKWVVQKLFNLKFNNMGPMWRKMTIFKWRKRLWRGTNVSNQLYRGDLDDLIDFQRIKKHVTSDIFKRKFWERWWWNYRLSKSKITLPLIFSNGIYGGDLDETIDFQSIKSRNLWYVQTECNGIY